jgi:hypothetical protein
MGDDTGEKGLFLNRKFLDHPLSDAPEVEGQLPWCARLPCTIKDKRLGHVYLGRALYTERGARERNQSCFGEELCESKWFTQGLILQERLLSRRIVYFGKRQLYWECQKKFKNEDGSPDSDDLIHYGSVSLRKQSFVENLLFEDFGGKVGDVDIQSIWREFVSHYSSRNLTFDADKVRAISGIAEALRRRFGLKNFHYGLWMDSLCMTGTRASIAIGPLLGEKHLFIDDLESFFWVLF